MPEHPTKTVLDLDLNGPEAVSNPYPLYDQLRSQDPVHWSEFDNHWYITRYTDLTSLIRDERISTARGDECSTTGISCSIATNGVELRPPEGQVPS